MNIRLLGTGTSSGVPRIGNDWGSCDPREPRNRRLRSSALVEHAGTRILIDTSPDMREQLLAAGVAVVDAVIWTHDHADHCHGIDDLRQVYHAKHSPVVGYARADTLEALTERFTYAFAGRAGYPPTIAAEVLPAEIQIGGIKVSSVDQPHGSIQSVGLRFEAGSIAIGYATDFHCLTEEMIDLYRGLDVWIVDALRRAPHPTHPDLGTVLRWVERLAPTRTALVHMDHSMDYATLVAELPPGVEPGFDGLCLP